MWPETNLTRSLGLDWPIVQAPMASAATPALAAAVANAGGLGSLGLATAEPEAARAQIEAFRAASNRSLNVNFFCHAEPLNVAARSAAMRARLAGFYQEQGLGEVPEASLPYRSFGAPKLELVLALRPTVVELPFRAAGTGSRGRHQGGRLPSLVERHHGGRSALARGAWV